MFDKKKVLLFVLMGLGLGISKQQAYMGPGEVRSMLEPISASGSSNDTSSGAMGYAIGCTTPAMFLLIIGASLATNNHMMEGVACLAFGALLQASACAAGIWYCARSENDGAARKPLLSQDDQNV